MPTQTEVESRLRRSLRSVAASTPVDSDWESFSARLEEFEGTLPSVRQVGTGRSVTTRPVLVLVSAFTVVLVGVGLLGVVSSGGGSNPAGTDIGHPLDDSLRYVPTAMPGYAPELHGWFTDGDLVEEGIVEPQPSSVFVKWADGKSRVDSGLVIWPAVETTADEIGRERDEEGFWVQDFDEYPWLRIRGETPEGLLFTVDGTGDIDRDLVYEAARSIRDGEPLPEAFNDLTDVTPSDEEYLTSPIERYWHLFAEGQGNHLDALVHSAIATTEPVVQLAMFPWSCELIQLDTSTGALCEPGEWRLVWEPTRDVVIGMSTVGFTREDVIDIANSMELMSASDPRMPPAYTSESE